MQNFHLIAKDQDFDALRLQIARQPWLWNQHKLRTHPNSPIAGTDDIWLRYNDFKNWNPERPQDFGAEHDSVWYPAAYALPAAREIAYTLMAEVQGERLGGVLITRVRAGGQIKAHEDHSWHVDYYDKFYCQLDSGPGATFWCGEERFDPERGDVYFFDNTKVHGVENTGLHDRMTLIVCIKTDRFKGAMP